MPGREEPQMRRSSWIAAVVPALGLAAYAGDDVDLSMKSKAVASAASTKVTVAPFAAARDPLPAMMVHEERVARGPRGACEASTLDLCYDLGEARIVYRPARRYMPSLGRDFTPESVSLRPNRIVFKYSFK
jgi:hypothetical protein